ncbi:snare-like protein [Venturia nashicola]|uniref:Snare-like protein n=1 Tax=Venturia nashicola TaxID=86259 RepID=A0A4Z1PQN4_9PEZI|nr:snare-like protein [Venturia nashicola]
MKVLHLAIVKNVTRPAVDLCAESDLTSYSRFMRGSYAEMIGLGSATIAERTKPGQRQDVENEKINATVHAYGRSEGICGIMITDPEYPGLVAHQVLSKIVDEFLNKNPVSNWIDSDAKVPFPELKEYLVKYQNPEEADSIMKIQKELDETKIVLHKTIQSVLERGEQMDKLAAESTRLSFQTKAFAKQAQKQNSCCILM